MAKESSGAAFVLILLCIFTKDGRPEVMTVNSPQQESRIQNFNSTIGMTYLPQEHKRCKSDLDCHSFRNGKCFQNICVEGGTRCLTDAQCPKSPFSQCVDSFCMRLGHQCTLDQDCPLFPLTVCVHSRCIRLGQSCTRSEECQSYPHSTCINGVCEKATIRRCGRDSDCNLSSNQYCERGYCVSTGQFCSRNCPCSNYPHISCIDSRCRRFGQPCRTSKDCAHPLMTCLNSICQLASRPDVSPTCKTDNQCNPAAYNFCIEGHCIILGQQCQSDRACPHGSQCVNSRCTKLGQQCTNTIDCPFPMYTMCKNGICRKSSVDEGRCYSDKQCNPSAYSFCISGRCISLGQHCRADSECTYDSQCVSTRCVKLGQQCTNTIDCPFPMYTMCKSGICQKNLGGEGRCYSDKQCNPSVGEVCMKERCVQLGQKCDKDDQCSFYPRTVCVNSVCTKLGQYCHSAPECPLYPHTTCVHSSCQKAVEKVSCKTDKECDRYPHTACINSKCERVGQDCSTDRDCGSNSEVLCINSKCTKVPQCKEDSECPSGRYCVASVCTELGQPCENDTTCTGYPDDAACINGECAKIGQNCIENADCPYTELSCVSSKCIKLGSCNSDKECPNTTYCIANRCVQLGQPCENDATCTGYPDDAACMDGKCAKIGQNCNENADCPYTELSCVSSKCMKLGSCKSDEECPETTYCMANRCIQMGQACERDTDCPYYPNSACVTGACVRAGQPCANDNECSSHLMCILSKCRPVGEYCTVDTDCKYYNVTVCVDSKCVKQGQPCTTDVDCSIPFKCLESKCSKTDETTKLLQLADTSFKDQRRLRRAVANQRRMQERRTRGWGARASTRGTTTTATKTQRMFLGAVAPALNAVQVKLLTQAGKRKVLELHNRYSSHAATGRAQKQGGATLPTTSTMLQYDDQLANDAADHAAKCTGSERRSGAQGEKHYQVEKDRTEIEMVTEAVSSWYDAASDGMTTDNSFAKHSKTFTQLDNGMGYKIGCAYADCSSSYFFVCRYLPNDGNKE